MDALRAGSMVENSLMGVTALAMLALLLVWLLSWLSLPALVKGPLERIASEQLGRTVTVGGIDFEPWSLEFALRDVAVAGANGAPPGA